MAKALAIACLLATPALSMPALGSIGTLARRIVGGEDAKLGQFPFIIAINDGPEHNPEKGCGGTLINSRTVVTAAHCVDVNATLRVRAGSIRWDMGGTVANVSKIFVNPDYQSAHNGSDIAVMQLASAIPKSSTIDYAHLPGQGSDPAAGTNVTTAGWGLTSAAINATSSDFLKFVTVSVQSRKDCAENHKKANETINDTMVCAGAENPGKDSCNGDSGGPLVVAGTNLLVGVVSWGVTCADEYGGVYARVGKYVDWIKGHSLPA